MIAKGHLAQTGSLSILFMTGIVATERQFSAHRFLHTFKCVPAQLAAWFTHHSKKPRDFPPFPNQISMAGFHESRRKYFSARAFHHVREGEMFCGLGREHTLLSFQKKTYIEWHRRHGKVF